MKPVREITSEEENFRLESHVIKRDPIKPVPAGTIVIKLFRVTGYDQDCDGSLMARLENIDKNGEPTGWEERAIGLYPECTLQLDSDHELQSLFREKP